MINEYFTRNKIIAIIVIIGVSFFAILFTNRFVLRDFPNSADEYSYLISAKLFAAGKLSVPSPEPRESFNFTHIVNDGRYYGKYYFGWPLFLGIGVLADFPILMNVVFGIASLLLLFFMTRELYSEQTALIALLLMAISPFFIFNSASYFSHPSALFFTLLFSYLYIINIRYRKRSIWFMMGISLGILFNIRSLDAVITGVAFFVFHIYTITKQNIVLKDKIKNTIAGLTGLGIFIGLYLFYNYLQTGNSLLPPFLKYNPDDHFGFNTWYLHSPSWSFEKNIIDNMINLTFWVPLSPVLAAAGLYLNRNKNRYFLAGFFLLFLIIYFFYARSGVNQYGPRYLYSPCFCVFILMALGFEKLSKPAASAVAGVMVLINIGLYGYIAYSHHIEIDNRMALYDAVKKAGITNTIVFVSPVSPTRNALSSGSMPAGDLTRNDITFREPVIYVHHKGSEDSQIMESYNDRSYYLWKCQDINVKYNRLISSYKSTNTNCTLSKYDGTIISDFQGIAQNPDMGRKSKTNRKEQL